MPRPLLVLLTAALSVLVGVGCGDDDSDDAAATSSEQADRVAVLERPFSTERDSLGGTHRSIRLLADLPDESIRLARTEDQTEYYVGEKGGEICFFSRTDGQIESATCNERETLRGDVIYLLRPDLEADTMDLRGVASDQIEEVAVGDTTDEPQENVFVLEDVPLSETLTLRFDDGREKDVDLASPPTQLPPPPPQ